MSSFWKFFTPNEEGEGEGAEGKDKEKVPPPPDTVKKPSKPPRAEMEKKRGESKPPPPPSISVTPTGPQLPGVMLEPTPARRSQPPSAETNMRYGIDDAIKLMRTLPVAENEYLVVRVMKTTLESLKVRVGDIIDDAMKRQDVLGKKVADYRAQITSFEREIEARRHEIHRLEEELNEVTKVKERLEATENLSMTPNPPFIPPASHTPPSPASPLSGHRGPPMPPPRKPELPKRPGSVPPKGELPPVIIAQSEPELIPASEKEPPKDAKDAKKDVYKDDD
jgi:hypothetical protein